MAVASRAARRTVWKRRSRSNRATQRGDRVRLQLEQDAPRDPSRGDLAEQADPRAQPLQADLETRP